MNIGILSAGGVCPGINAVIRGITLHETYAGNKVLGYQHGYKGLNENNKVILNMPLVQNIHCQAGTILHTSRERLDVDTCKNAMYDLKKLYCIGGNGTLEAAKLLSENYENTNVIGIAKTIDNDINGLQSFGFYTAVEATTRFIKCAFVEATSMNSVVIVETMGRNCGKLAKTSANYMNDIVDVCIVQEDNLNYNVLTENIVNIYSKQKFCVIVMSEGYKLKEELIDNLSEFGIIPKMFVPGYYVRSIEPNDYDKIECFKMTLEAFHKSEKGHKNFIQGINSSVYLKDFIPGENLVNASI